MNRILVLWVLCTFPTLALAAPGAHLLEGRLTLHLGALAGEAPPSELSAPPPPPPLVPLEDADESAPAPSLDLTPGEGPPSIGPVLGFLISGGVVLGVGAYVGLYSLLFFSEAASMGNSWGSAGLMEAAVTTLVIALIHLGIGIPLLVAGARKKAERNRYYEEHPNAWLQPGGAGKLTVFSF